MTGLTYLNVKTNNLSGTIPPLGALTKLVNLGLGNNELSGTVPSWLGSLAELTVLSLGDNKLSGTIHSLQYPDKLATLILENNMLSGPLPDDSVLPDTIRVLKLAGNVFTGAIPDLATDTLEELWFRDNNLVGAVPAFNALTNLKVIEFHGNDLSGTLPDLSGRANLYNLVLSENMISGIIDEARLPEEKLLYLYLYGNDLSGTLPDLSTFTKLQYLILSDNRLSGTIDSAKLPTQALQLLYLYGNDLSGILPDLSNHTKLYYLLFNDNRLSGIIDDTRLPNTTYYLYLNNNNLSGEIPDFATQSILFRLYLSDNQLSGTIPTELGSRTYLSQLYLNDNDLSGTIPTELGSLASLTHLVLRRNSLGGEIPTELGNLTSLTQLYLNDNKLSGEIPTELGSLTSLMHLVLDRNSLSGEIPSQINSLTKLNYLYLHDNELTGSGSDLSPDFSSLTQLKELSLWGNAEPTGTVDLHSSVATSVIDRAALRVFHNDTGGQDWSNRTGWLESDLPLEQWHGVTTDAESGRVTALDLSGNGLKNPVRSSLEALDSLTALNLSDNANLTGTLPVRLKDVSGLSSLNIECTGVQTPSDTEWPPNGAPSSFLLKGCPGKPGLSTVEPGIRSLTVSWTAALQATGYKVQWKSGAQDWDGTARQNTVSDGSATTSEITGLAGGVEYTVRVISTKDGNDGASSEEVKGTPKSPPSAPPPPPPPPAPAPPTPVSPDDSVLITETDDGFAFTPVGAGGNVVYGTETIGFTVTGNDGLSPNPTIVLSRDVLGAVGDAGGSVTFEVSADLSGNPPSGFRLGGLVADIGLGVKLEAEETVGVCLPADAGAGGPVVHRYDGESGTWEPIPEQETSGLNGVRSVCGKTDAVTRFGLFVVEEEPVPPPAVEEGGGGCAVAGAGSGSAIPPADLLSAGLLLLAAVSFRRRALRKQRKGS